MAPESNRSSIPDPDNSQFEEPLSSKFGTNKTVTARFRPRLEPLSSKFGTHKTIAARLWPRLAPLPGESLSTLLSCSFFARKRFQEKGAGQEANWLWV